MTKHPSNPSRRKACVAGSAALLALLAGVPGCGGVGEDGTGAPVTISVGVVTGLSDTSVTVNDVTFEKNGAAVTDGFGMRLTFDDLRLGMWLEVQGTIDEATALGKAVTIRVRPAVRGVVTSVGGDGASISLLQSTVRYDIGITVVDGLDSTLDLAPGDTVEVHGALGAAAGSVEATRLEKLASADAKPFELRGRVVALDAMARTMTVGRQVVSYADAVVTLRQSLAVGQVVRVSATLPPTAGRPWRVERLTTDQALPANAGFVYAEGVVSSWTTGPRFALEDAPVDATTANNRVVVTADGQRVAIIGFVRDGTLVARSVAIVRPGQPVVFTLSGPVTNFVSVSDFRVRSTSIDATAATYTAGAAGDLANGKVVRVVGTLQGRRIVASKVQFLP
jgi:hypothetical protein